MNRTRDWRRYKTIVINRRIVHWYKANHVFIHDPAYLPDKWKIRYYPLHCRCDWCVTPYNRNKAKQQFRSQLVDII